MPFKLALSALVATAVAAAAPAAAQAPVAQAAVAGEGPGGRMPLSSWTLRLDSGDRGLSLGWQRGGFSGRRASVPGVIAASDYTGARGTAKKHLWLMSHK